jgi:hypothetical protein
MAIFPTPNIETNDYEAFQRILGSELPSTYEEWSYQESAAAADVVMRGHTVRQIQVDAAEFARYLSTMRAPRTVQSLRNFAGDKSSGKSY